MRPKPATKNYNNHLNYVILITCKHHPFSPTLLLALAQGWDVLDHCLLQDMKSQVVNPPLEEILQENCVLIQALPLLDQSGLSFHLLGFGFLIYQM